MTEPQNFTFSKEQIRERYGDHGHLAELFIDALGKEVNKKSVKVEFHVNSRKLFLAIQSAYQDIARYKNYHQNNPWEQKLDAVKRSAFLLKWIVRFKPIEYSTVNEGETDTPELDKFELANELFAILVAEEHLSLEARVNFEFSIQKQYELVYDLLYRNISTDGWIAILQITFEAVSDVDNLSFLSRL